MARTKSSSFTTIRSEGGLLPSDLLARIAERDRSLPGLTETAYHLDAGARFGEVINRSWNRLQGAWPAFQDALARLPDADPATSVTRERWLLVLFQELGYGRLQAAGAISAEGRSFTISHEWGAVPIHLVGARLDLDTRAAGVAGAARRTPHSAVQEVLNASPEHLWGVVSNGRQLRLLRDSAAMTRQTFLEFNLEAMMVETAYSDFVLLWLLLHQSRFEGDPPETSWIEQWAQEAQAQGTRALDHLREGVERAVVAFGRGFLGHPANTALREALRDSALDTQDLYRQLLRLAYRMIFLLVAEDRRLLQPSSVPDAQRRLYEDFYSVARLRSLAEEIKGTQHSDLFRGLRLVMAALGADAGCPSLGLPALGSFLWSPEAISNLEECEISNRYLLEAVSALSFTRAEGIRRPVDYRNLGSEELGSVYESLLELHPEMNGGPESFRLTAAGGHERRVTGSYYTPAAVIGALLDESLTPLLDAAVQAASPEAAMLGLKILDPACGSGHFLVAAANRIAKRLATVRSGDEEPAPDAVKAALRDVVAHCIYGIDLNEMAVELCKVSLWMETLEAGKPLAFLEHRILCGNGVVGATPSLIAKGIPDEAFLAIEGDDRTIAAQLRRRNAVERGGQELLPIDTPAASGRGLADQIAAIDALDENTLEGVREKERLYAALRASQKLTAAKLVADAWCAAFFTVKAKGVPAITTGVLRALESEQSSDSALLELVRILADKYRFLHPHLAFPNVFAATDKDSDLGLGGGFDFVLGNPPWDTLSPDAKEHFSAYDPQIRSLDRAGQIALIERLLEDPAVLARWTGYRRDLYAEVSFFKNSGRFRLFAPGNLGKGDFNIYRMFVETALQLARKHGQVAQVVPSGLYSGANCMAIRRYLMESCKWSVLLGFTNTREVWFPGIHTQTTFCIYAAEVRSPPVEALRVAFGIDSHVALANARSADVLELPFSVVRHQSPQALAVPELSSRYEISTAGRMQARWPQLGDSNGGPPIRRYMAEIHMGNDRDIFEPDPPGTPVMEGRMVDAYDYRAKGYRSGRGRSAVWEALAWADPSKSIQPQWWIRYDRLPAKVLPQVKKYRLAFCDVTSATTDRSLMAALVPPDVVCGHSLPVMTFDPEYEWAYMLWLAVANSFATDFLARLRVTLHMNFNILDALPFPRLPVRHPIARELVPLALRLTCTGPEMLDYWKAMASQGWVSDADERPATGAIEPAERDSIRAEVDAMVFRHVYGLTRDDVTYILNTFRIVRERDERLFGEFRTSRLILEKFDGLAESASDLERGLEVSV